MAPEAVVDHERPARSRRWGPWLVAALVAIACLAAGLAPAVRDRALSGVGLRPIAPVVDQPLPVTPPAELAASLRQADDLARGRPTDCSGAWWDADARSVVLGVAGAHRQDAARAALDAAGLGDVRVRVVRHSLADLQDLSGRLTRATGPLRSEITRAGPDPAHDRVLVGVARSSTAVRRQVYEIAGDAAAVVRTGGRFSGEDPPV